MTIVAEKYAYVIGVDTHAKTHTYAITATTTGTCLGCEAFPVTAAGIKRAIGWIHRNTSGEILAAVEGTCSYGASLTRALVNENLPVVEAKPPRKKTRGSAGKTDAIDAIAAATGILGTEINRLLYPRIEGTRTALGVLLASRRRLEGQSTANRNALNALVRQIDLGLDTREALSDKKVAEIGSWRARPSDTVEQQIGREEATNLALSITAAAGRLKTNETQLGRLCEELAPGLQDQPGLGPVTAGIILAAYSHHGRVRDEAAFASLAGVSPLQASSGNTIRHRLNRTGDRQLNMALDIIAKTRMRCDEKTKEFLERRTAQGLSYRDIKRVLKRYIARDLFRQLEKLFT
ncbi:transposase of ISAar41, IS110 family [Arthrobacter sp. PAMC 25486]|uniref:IS110 family transposase n=1 Tax=Arthrobacter sp. PAMC 25486 TaxID=1494608 RepID=UPI0005359DF7|nr:IS110 family transposase [Arthrobacter sp. PAMC 25486]AIY02234.1 transposase of ISAar41, IS110 family [Arthrobacter sp. PAMC 25486]